MTTIAARARAGAGLTFGALAIVLGGCSEGRPNAVAPGMDASPGTEHDASTIGGGGSGGSGADRGNGGSGGDGDGGDRGNGGNGSIVGSGGEIAGAAGMTGAGGIGGANGGGGGAGGANGPGGASGSGDALPQGVTWIPANSVATGDQDNAAIAAVRTGYVAVVWEDDRDTPASEDSVHSEIFLRLFLDDVPLYEVKLSNGGSGNWRHIQPDVALFDDGRAVVAWAEEADGNDYYNVQVRLVRTDGTVGGSVVANDNVDGQQTAPAVAASPEGSAFAVVWEDTQGANPPTVRMSGYAAIGSKTYEAQVHGSGGAHRRPDVAMGAAGNAIVVWEEDGDGNGQFNIGRKIFTPTGAVRLDQGVASASPGGQRARPSVAANFNGDFAVAWETEQSGTVAAAVRSFTAAGIAHTTTDTLLRGADPQVGIDDEERVVVAWWEASDIHVQGLNADGSPTGRLPRLLIGEATTGRQDQPALVVDPWGRLAIAYTDDHDGNLFDQVILGTGLLNSLW